MDIAKGFMNKDHPDCSIEDGYYRPIVLITIAMALPRSTWILRSDGYERHS